MVKANSRQRLTRAFGRHETLPDQEGAVAEPPQVPDVGRSPQPTFGNRHDLARQSMRQRLEHGRIHLERAQVPAVDADDLSPRVEGHIELALIVLLNERGKPLPGRRLHECSELARRHRCDNQEHGVGTDGLDPSGPLMAEDDGIRGGAVRLAHGEIGVAHPGGNDPYEHFTGTGIAELEFGQLKGSVG